MGTSAENRSPQNESSLAFAASTQSVPSIGRVKLINTARQADGIGLNEARTVIDALIEAGALAVGDAVGETSCHREHVDTLPVISMLRRALAVQNVFIATLGDDRADDRYVLCTVNEIVQKVIDGLDGGEFDQDAPAP
jgi:hypothetical protein